MKGVLTRQCPSLGWTWWMINLPTSRVAKDQRRHKISFATFTRRGVYLSFAISSSNAKIPIDNELSNHTNTIKAFMDKFACLQVSIKVKMLSWLCVRAWSLHIKTQSPYRWTFSFFFLEYVIECLMFMSHTTQPGGLSTPKRKWECVSIDFIVRLIPTKQRTWCNFRVCQ